MAGAHLAFTLLIVAILEDSQANSINAHGMMNVKPYLDPKRRSEIVDQAFSEQKDVLLDMLETKLKEVRDKKKKKTHFLEANHTINNSFENNKPCDKNLQNLDVKLKVNGISAIGDTNLQLKHGTGKDSLNLDANGISNIGKVHVEVGVGASSLYIPGLSNLFVGLGCHNCTKLNLTTEHEAEKANNTRRSEVESNLNETTAATQNITTTLEVTSQGSEVAKNETVQTTANPSSVLPIAVTTVANITANNTV
ncbi:uncharacterized protein LOC135117926 [Helicoverpa armigera]|uniref:uncharacterized protein LOC135117926 n=1 Tax=Helicoverpa armigera TaxID=29058 RepID=UPI0030833F30